MNEIHPPSHDFGRSWEYALKVTTLAPFVAANVQLESHVRVIGSNPWLFVDRSRFEHVHSVSVSPVVSMWMVNDAQWTRLAAAFALQVAKKPGSALCGVCVDLLAVAGAGITIMNGTLTGPLCVSNTRMSALEDLQFTLGEGPCQDAFRQGSPVLAPRLDDAAFARWPAFINQAHDTGVEAVFAYPLVMGRSKVGVLTLYQDFAGDLTADQHDDSMALADILARTILGMQAAAPPGMVPLEMNEPLAYRAEVHQASGMVAVQLQVPPAEALAALRAHAFACNQSVTTVAADIVARRLRLSNDPAGDTKEAVL